MDITNLSRTTMKRLIARYIFAASLLVPAALAAQAEDLPRLDQIPDRGLCDPLAEHSEVSYEFVLACTGCVVDNPQLAADGDESTYAEVSYPASASQNTVVFVATAVSEPLQAFLGYFGALSAEPAEMINWSRIMRAYRNGDQVGFYSASGAAGTRSDKPAYYRDGLSKTADRLELELSAITLQGGSLKVFELCTQ